MKIEKRTARLRGPDGGPASGCSQVSGHPQYTGKTSACQTVSFTYPTDQAAAIRARLARLEAQTGIPQSIIVQSLIMASDTQLVRVCAAGTPATSWRRRAGLDPLPIAFMFEGGTA